MKVKHLIILYVVSLLLSIATQPSFAQPFQGTVAPGSGYSNDMQQLSTSSCFKNTSLSIDPAVQHEQLHNSQTYLDIARALNINLNDNKTIELFLNNEYTAYLKSIMDREYSFSISYYNFSTAKNHIGISEKGLDALTEDGRYSYTNESIKKYFGLICGDAYVSSYSTGAILIMSLMVEFDTIDDKKSFLSYAGTDFTDIFSAYGKIKQIANKYNINASITVQAYQKGGEPYKLFDIFKKDPSGNYYILDCNLKNMDKCEKVAEGMAGYAKDNFPNQFSFKNGGKNIDPLGINFAEFTDIKSLDLIPSPSFVDDDILKYRTILANELAKNVYYYNKFYDILEKYPGKWDTFGETYRNIRKLLRALQENIDTITDPANIGTGAMECYNEPYACKDIYSSIIDRLHPDPDLSVLEPLKYVIRFGGADVYPCDSSDIYCGAASNGNYPSLQNFNKATITNTTCNVDVNLNYEYGNKQMAIRNIFTGTSTDGINYTGELCLQCGPFSCLATNKCPNKPGSFIPCQTGTYCQENQKYSKTISDYYFTKYNDTNSSY